MSAGRFVGAGIVSVVALAGGVPAGHAAVRNGVVEIVQAVPDAKVTVSIDGKRVRSAAGVGSILGPYDVAPGKHSVRFTDPASKVAMNATITVRPGTNTDVVLHRPAAVSGQPTVNVYHTPRRPIGPGRARILVAHTATVAPADVRVDGKVVFRNIANGEYAEADVPAGSHRVELLPAGRATNPILGPVKVRLPARTVTMVYAVGTPMNGSMDVIAHASRLSSDGTVVPDTIKTGSAGLVTAPVPTFGPANDQAGGSTHLWWWAAAAVACTAAASRRLSLPRSGRHGPAVTAR